MSLSGSFVSSFPIIGDISEVVIAPIVKMNEKDESENPKSLVTGSKNNVVILLTILNATAIYKILISYSFVHTPNKSYSLEFDK